jgi:hypothetical protein
MTLLPYGICIIDLLSILMLGLGLRQLRPAKNQIQQFLGVERIRMLTRGLLVGPLLLILGLLVFFIFILRDAYLPRLSHGAFVLGLWMVLTIAFFILALTSRLNIRPVVQTLAAPVLAVPLVAYLTPYERFLEVFAHTPTYLPLVVGLVVVALGYYLILQVRRELL